MCDFLRQIDQAMQNYSIVKISTILAQFFIVHNVKFAVT